MSPRLAWIWPKDPRPGNQSSSHWPRYWRLHDVLTNKGPDMYVGVVGGGKMKKVNWSGWPVKQQNHQHQNQHRDTHQHQHENYSDNGHQHQQASCSSCCCPCSETGEIDRQKRRRKKTPAMQIGFSGRASTMRYDFRTRQYVVPDCGTWSRVEYCGRRGHVVPLRYWDWDGVEYPAECWHDVAYGRCRS